VFFFYRYLLTGNENVNGNVIETERERERAFPSFRGLEDVCVR